MDPQLSNKVRAALRHALELQIDIQDPPETKQTFARLIECGVPRDEAWRLLSAVLATELAAIERDKRPFDRDAYCSALRRLPSLPTSE